VISKAVKILIIFITVTVAVYYGLFYTQEVSKLVTYGRSGYVQSNVIGADSNLVFAQVDTLDFATPPIPTVGDRVLYLNDSVATTAGLIAEFASPHPAGYETIIRYQSDGDTLQTVVRSRPLPRRTFVVQAVLMVLRFLISLSFFAVGLWAFAKRPDSGAVRALTLFCYAMGCFLMTVVNMISDTFSSINLPLLDIIEQGIGLLAMFFGAFWLNLQLLFPSPLSIMRKHPLTVYTLCYLPLGLVGTATALTQTAALGYTLISLVALQVGLGFYVLGRNHSRTTEPIEKRQTRLVLWGTGIGLGGFVLFIIFAIAASTWLRSIPDNVVLIVLMAVFLGLLLSPLSFAYAFGKYRLLEIEGRIKRGTRHILIALALLALFYLCIFVASEFTIRTLGIESRTPVLIIALLLAIGFAPAQKRLLGSLDKWIYPERFRLKGMLDDFLRQSVAMTDKRTFWIELENRLKAALKVEHIYPVLRAANNGHFEHWTGTPTPFEKSSSFIETISRVGGRPVMRDELEAGGRISFRTVERDWFDDRQVELVLPMVTRAQLIGFLGIGSKSERSDFEPADFEILQSLGNQIAVATDNIILLEENVDKRRLEAELSIARKVQEGMLPHDIPDTPGLQVSALSRFCTEVAGDYYDVIDVGDGRTVLAIGDVSGKGAGAALLMSNVQASLRTAIGIETPAESGATAAPAQDIDLARIVTNINRLIHRNSQPEQFITFFVGVYDPKARRLDFVNAGHNPPLAVSRSGEVVELFDGGVLLGAVPDFPYQQGMLSVSPGDVVFLYTDGLSESTRPDGKMFGEERIKQFLVKHVELTPQQLLAELEKDVNGFVGGAHLSDDFTLVAAKTI
jgi:serine phosphatase RsbU (regulator of sigma subunit)